MSLISRKIPVIFALCFAVLISMVKSEETILPTAIPPFRYFEVWDDSPFLREVVKPVETVAAPLNQSWVLEGLIEDDQVGHIAYVRDLATEELMVITSKKRDDHPLVIISADHASDPEKAKVKVYDGTKSTDIGFAAHSLTSAIASPIVGNPGAQAPPTAPGRPGAFASKRLGNVQKSKSTKGTSLPRLDPAVGDGNAAGNGSQPDETKNPSTPTERETTSAAKDKRARKLRILPQR